MNHPSDPPRRIAKWAFGAGGISSLLSAQAILNFVYQIYNVILGADLVLLSTALAIAQVLGLAVAPMAGSWSDNCRSRYGRRRPFIFVFGLISAALCGLFFLFPGERSPAFYAWYCGAILIAFNVSWSIWQGPYSGLLPDLAVTVEDRNSVSALQAQLRMVGGLLMVWLLPVAQSRFFPSTQTGIRSVGLLIAAVSAGGVLLTVLLVKEKFSAPQAAGDRLSLRESLRQTFQIKPIYPLVAATILFGAAGSWLNTLGYYVVLYYTRGGDTVSANYYSALGGSCWLGGVLICSGFLARASARLTRRRLMYLLSVVLVGSCLMKLLCFRPGMGYASILPYLFFGPASSLPLIIFTAEAADVTDYDELVNGQRREGIIFSVLMTISNVSVAISGPISGYLLAWVGFDRALGAHQSPVVLHRLLAILVALPSVLALAGAWAHSRYPLTELKMLEIRRDLDARRSSALGTTQSILSSTP